MSSLTYRSGGRAIKVSITKEKKCIVPDGHCKGRNEMGFTIEEIPAAQKSPRDNRAGRTKRKIGEGGKT